MKSAFYFNLKINLLFLFIVITVFTSCKKEYVPESKSLNASNKSDVYASDGTVAIQMSIFPPTTPQSFIANGGTSIVQYQITTTKGLLDIYALGTATYPAINYVFYGNVALNSGTVYMDPFGAFPHPGSALTTCEIHYNPVDSATSGTIAQLKVKSLSYLTYDNVSYSFNFTSAGDAPPMCLVNNIAHVSFQSPPDDTLQNGYPEIAQVKLTGDTTWTLNSLPLSIYNPSSIPSPNSKIIVKYNKTKVGNTGNPIVFDPNGNAKTVVHFNGGFKHIAGQKEVLKIYADVPYHDLRHIYTTMQPLSSFVWTDGVGKQIGGKLNAVYYKEETGEASY